METEIQRTITTENGESEFQVRVIKSEGVGLLTTKSNENYLLLDSVDYWYDLIQDKYPLKKKCRCKNEWFTAKLIYIPRFNTNDIREIEFITTCTNCSKSVTQFSVDIKYSPTQHLIDKPITYCEKPKIKYHSKQINGYWNDDDIRNFIQYMNVELKANLYVWYWGEVTLLEKMDYVDAMKIISRENDCNYLSIYLSENTLPLDDLIAYKDNEVGAVPFEDLWQKNELIELCAPISTGAINGENGDYTLVYGHQYIDKGEVMDKSDSFKQFTENVTNYLSNKFITTRGVNCFDNKELYELSLSNN